MRNYIYTLILVGLVSITGFGQKMEIENGKLGGILPVNEERIVTYQIVEQVPGISQSELFQRARKWFTQAYKSPNDVLQVNDANTGELTGKGVFTINPTMMGMGILTYVDHTISVEVKEGRYRVTINNFFVNAKSVVGPIESVKGTTKGFLTKVYTLTDEKTNQMVSSLKKAMNTSKNDF